jgi:RNA polymerase sigma-70 factor (ECF subfamily)
MGAGPETRLSLLARLREPNDQEAWREFVAIYQPLIQRLATHRGRWTPDPNRASFRTWLFRIARNLMINLLKQKQRLPFTAGGTDMLELLQNQPARDGNGKTEWFDEEFRRELFRWSAERIRGEFRESTWQAFWQTCVDGKSVAMVADTLKMSVGAVYVARSRVMARLKQVIETHERESQSW